jgi:anaerobic magnesium-protoporphyrin IX monomethyl ester cyclase
MRIALINYDNGSRIPVMPQNLFLLKEAAERQGHTVILFDFNLTKEPYDILDYVNFDVVGLGFISGYWPHAEAQKIAKAVAKRRPKWFILGGHGPAADPEYYMKLLGADAVFTGAADISFPNWLKHPEPGIIGSEGYRMSLPQINLTQGLEVYKRVRFPNTRENEFAIQILSGRGCPYKCAFCFRNDKHFARYNTEDLFDDIRHYHKYHGITHFQFSDELLMVGSIRCLEILDVLRDLQRRCGNALRFDCNGRLNIAAKSPELLKLMKKTGFTYINYGCESMSQEVLNNIDKKQTVAEIYEGIENTIAAGITPGLNFMWGNPGDNYRTLWDAANFINQYTDYSELRTIRPVTPYPGTDLFDRLGISVDEFYSVHTNSDLFSFHFMDGISNEDADKNLCEANKFLFRAYMKHKTEAQVEAMERFYTLDIDPATFRGFREV